MSPHSSEVLCQRRRHKTVRVERRLTAAAAVLIVMAAVSLYALLPMLA